MATKKPRELRIGDRVQGRTSRGREVAGKVVEIRPCAGGQTYVGVLERGADRPRFTRPSQLTRV